MTHYDLMDKQEKEFMAYIKEKNASYDRLRRRIVKSMWQLCQTQDFVFIEKISVVMEEIQEWEAEWGTSGRRYRALGIKHKDEWTELNAYRRMVDEFASQVRFLKN